MLCRYKARGRSGYWQVRLPYQGLGQCEDWAGGWGPWGHQEAEVAGKSRTTALPREARVENRDMLGLGV